MPLPSEWVTRLFSRFQAIYGNRAQTMWKDADPNEVRSVWADALGHYEAQDVRRALEAMVMAYTEFPPTLPQFTSLCRDARSARTQTTAKLDYNPRGEMPANVRAFLDDFKRRAAR